MAVFRAVGGEAGDRGPSGAVPQRVFERRLLHIGLLLRAEADSAVPTWS